MCLTSCLVCVFCGERTFRLSSFHISRYYSLSIYLFIDYELHEIRVPAHLVHHSACYILSKYLWTQWNTVHCRFIYTNENLKWTQMSNIRGVLWREWCWSWSSSTLATSCEELTHWKRLWCWEGLGAVGERDDWGWDGWTASRTRWTWVWVNSGRWWWTGRPGVLRFMGSQRVGHDWATELNWTESILKLFRAWFIYSPL